MATVTGTVLRVSPKGNISDIDIHVTGREDIGGRYQDTDFIELFDDLDDEQIRFLFKQRIRKALKAANTRKVADIQAEIESWSFET